MLRFLADENFNNHIVQGILRRKNSAAIVRVQDENLSGTADPEVLEWAANQNRIVLTHDVSTMTHYAYERVRGRLAMPGIFEVGTQLSLSIAIEDILLITECSLEGEWEGQVRYLPL